MALSIQDATWGQLVRFTDYKAPQVACESFLVPADYSTQECFHCGTLNKVALDIRPFDCFGCDRVLERDLNAARIVLKRGLTYGRA